MHSFKAMIYILEESLIDAYLPFVTGRKLSCLPFKIAMCFLKSFPDGNITSGFGI